MCLVSGHGNKFLNCFFMNQIWCLKYWNYHRTFFTFWKQKLKSNTSTTIHTLISGVVIIVLVSKVHILVTLSNFAWCWMPRESVLLGSSAHNAMRTAQNLKVPLIDELLKLTLLSLHQKFRPLYFHYFLLIFFTIHRLFTSFFCT